jgi:two-component system sensor histidine kinase KdpD
VAFGAVAAATVLGLVSGDRLTLPDETMIFVFAIMLAALGGRGPGLVAAALSVACYDFFFVPPRYTLAVADVHDVMTFAVMFAVGTAMGTLVARVRRARETEVRARAEELRSSLLSAVSHDLRTPLAAITGMATQLRDSAKTTEDREALDTIVDEASRLGKILTNVLALTRVERAEVKGEWVPVEELVGATLDRAEATLAGRDVAIDVPAELGVTVDPVLVEQLLGNLVDNAAKHTPAGSPIAISARRDGAGTTIEIADRGPGLPAGPSDQLFAKFYRGPGVRTAGAGLGLAVCRGIAIAHGGSITATARDGGGASFRVWLPGAEAPT